MLYIDRSRISPPLALLEFAERELPQMEDFFSVPPKSRRQHRYKFPPISRVPGLLDTLRELFFEKCAYCERPIQEVDLGGIDRFRPKQNAMNFNGQASPDHYWWLAHEWSNLYHICWNCNRLKAERFPVRGQRVEIHAPLNELRHEGNMLLDPCLDFPPQHLVFARTGTVAGATEQGEVTINAFDLNSESLVKARRAELKSLLTTFKQLKSMASADNEPTGGSASALRLLVESITLKLQDSVSFAGAKQQLAMQWLKVNSLDQHPALASLYGSLSRVTRNVPKREHARIELKLKIIQDRQASYSIEDESAASKRAYYAAGKRIERIELRNFRLFSDLKLSFPDVHEYRESWLMLLGENGMGKSSILQAVALTLMGEKHANSLGLDASTFVRREARSRGGYVRVFLSNIEKPIELAFRRDSRDFTVTPKEPKVLVLGYGATRLLPRFGHVSNELSTFVRVSNLFDPFSPLSDAQAWLANTKRVRKAQFDQVALALKDVLMLREESVFVRAKGKITVRLGHNNASLENLSTGYQSVVALVIDIMISLLERWSSTQVAEGIVLLDEIEAHLHPRWKIEIVGRLRRAFPQVQFLVTTHDPLCLKGLEERELAVLEEQPGKGVVANTNIPPIQGMRADQLLTTFLFGLSGTRGSDMERKKQIYVELMSKQERSDEEELEFTQLRAELTNTIQVSETPVARLVEQAMHKILLNEDELRNIIRHYAAQMGTSAPPQTAATTSAITAEPDTLRSAPTEVLDDIRRQLTNLLS